LPAGDTSPGGWPLLAYIPFLLGGFVIVSHQRLQARLQQMRWVSLMLILVFTGIYFYLRIFPEFAGLYDDLNGPLFSFMSWSMILTAMGFTARNLTFTTPSLEYANEAVLPFYIMHQTVLLAIGYIVLQWQIPDFAKWIIITITSFVTIMALYEFLVRRINVLRFLFGMKVLPKAPAAQPQMEPSHP
ncbi:MAG: acyltransferase family protein, partial [Anaerolineales bacterium]